MIDTLGLVVAGLLSGMLNAVAGGGSFITLPALIFLGLPPVVANATGTAAQLPGYVMSAWRFRRDIALPANIHPLSLLALCLVGGVLGAWLLTVGRAEVFDRLVPWLILFATALFALGPALMLALRGLPWQFGLLLLFAACVYGGYFNGGLGIILLAVLSVLGQHNLHGMNGLKSALSAGLTAVAVLVYSAGELIAWPQLWVMAAASLVGGYWGAALAYRIPPALLRGGIVTVGILMAVVFFVRA